ncbi:MAG: aminoacyl-tRNA hydrolase [Elusimicrobiales bacterium]|nr:aminoacyl-tRNA hydrolase [Elusimicrobiales bacterium]
MEDQVQLAVLLGNPGPEYEKTRHNIGFMVADLAAGRLAPGERWRDWKGVGLYVEFQSGGRRCFLLKPQTYMNLSGRAVQSLGGFYKVPPRAILAVYDDLALPFGKLRLRKDGSGGSHNGMNSVIEAVGPSLPRLRLGIGPRPAHIPGTNFVLSRFSKEEEERLPAFLAAACDALAGTFSDGVEKAMNAFNNAI